MAKRIRTPKGDEPVRPCGGCTRCCTNMAIEELDKPIDVDCTYLHPDGGCGRYETRPQSCREFECLWRKGLGTRYLRPDKSDVMYCTTSNGSALVGFVTPGRPGAWKRGESHEVVKWHVKNGVPVFIVDQGKRYTLMPNKSHMTDAELEAMKSTFLSDDSLPEFD